jgi:hypothetical protein
MDYATERGMIYEVNCRGCGIAVAAKGPHRKWCADCYTRTKRASSRNWHLRNRQRVRDYQARRRAERDEQAQAAHLAYQRAYYAEHGERLRARKRAQRRLKNGDTPWTSPSII